jgi:hypothetical protein
MNKCKCHEEWWDCLCDYCWSKYTKQLRQKVLEKIGVPESIKKKYNVVIKDGTVHIGAKKNDKTYLGTRTRRRTHKTHK